jgi:hypothetical protein
MLFQCSIFTFFCRLVRRLHVNLRTLFCLTKRWQIQIIYRFTWKYIICLRCVCLKLTDCFLSSPFLNICLSSLLSSLKRWHILCTREHGKRKIKCIIFYSHECLCEILHLISTVVCQMSTLYCGKGGVQKYFLYTQMTIQCVECAITEIYLLLVARNL